jgi:hypothetical protein
VAVGVPVLSVFLWCWLFHSVPRQHFDRLLAGDASVEVTSAVIFGQQQPSIEITDAEAVRFLTHALRTAEHQGHVPKHHGISYSLGLKLRGSLGAVYVSVDAPDDAVGWTVGYPMDDIGDPKYYWLPFTDETPESILAATARMKSAHRPPTSKPTTP